MMNDNIYDVIHKAYQDRRNSRFYALRCKFDMIDKRDLITGAAIGFSIFMAVVACCLALVAIALDQGWTVTN